MCWRGVGIEDALVCFADLEEQPDAPHLLLHGGMATPTTHGIKSATWLFWDNISCLSRTRRGAIVFEVEDILSRIQARCLVNGVDRRLKSLVLGPSR